jgi:hypothetical protein
LVTDSENDDAVSKNTATDRARLIATVHLRACPEHAPPQPVKLDVDCGRASRVTVVPARNGSAQSLPHVTPAGTLVTVPPPAPRVVTPSVNSRACRTAHTSETYARVQLLRS